LTDVKIAQVILGFLDTRVNLAATDQGLA